MSTSAPENFRTYVVTGAAGLLGTEVVSQLLDRGHHVVAVAHKKCIAISHPNLIVERCNILDNYALESIFENADGVFHCAAVVTFHPKDRHELFQVNVDGTASVVNACLVSGIKKLIHVSSVSALGRIRPGEVVNESMQWTEETSNSIYGKSKYYAEMEVWRGIGEGLNADVVCPSTILGGNNWDDGSSALFKKAWEEFPWYAPGGGGFVDVRDVACSMIMLMNSEIVGEKYIISGENLSYKYVFDLMAAAFQKRQPHKKVNRFLSELVWRAEMLKSKVFGKPSVLNKETARTAMTTVKYNNSKFLTDFPDFHYTPIDETIRFTCNRMAKRYNLTVNN